MDRAKATSRLEEVVGILAAALDEPLRRVSALYVFGSYARGALVVGDIDVDVEYDVDHERALKETQLQSYGRNPRGDLSSALFRGQRIFQVHYESHARLESELGGLVLLWKRGDRVEDALARLHGLAADPAAGRSQRDRVAPPLEGLEHWVARPVRNELTKAIESGVLSVEQLELAEARPGRGEAEESIEDRWGPESPTRRAALAAAAYLESVGIKGTTAWYRGWASLSADGGRAMVGFGHRDIEDAPRYLTGDYGDLWLQVVNPSRRAPLRALLIRRHPSSPSGEE